MSSIKLTSSLVAIAFLFALTGCTATQPQFVADKNGLGEVPGRLEGAGHQEFKFPDGTVVMPPTFDGRSTARIPVEVNFKDGAVLSVFKRRDLDGKVAHDNSTAAGAMCKQYSVADCPNIEYPGLYYSLIPLDGRSWMDTETWSLADYDAETDALKYQACRDGHFYSAGDLKTLMDVVDKAESDPTGAKSDPEVAKYLLADDKLILRLPVCNWRHRIGLDAAFPPPAEVAKTRIVPASHTRLKYIEAKGDKGGLDVYIDENQHRIDHFVFLTPKGPLTLRPAYNGNDCPTLDRCEHMTMGFGKHEDLFDIRSLDDEPLSLSRLFEVRNTLDGTKRYNGCAGGRLYAGKNRQTVESEIKIALENPAPPRPAGAPMLGAPAIAESGDTVIPDAFCDWTARTRQMQAAMKNQAASP